MNFTIPVDAFQNVVRKMSYILKVATDDVTSMMMIEALDDEVRFSGNSGSVGLLITNKDCDVAEKGKVLLQLRDISGYIAKFVPINNGVGTEKFNILSKDILDEKSEQVVNTEWVIKSKTSFKSGKPAYKTLKFKSYDTNSLPPIKEFEDAELIINSDIILEGLNKILHCVDPNEIREAVAGMYLSIDDNKIVFTGTNGIKLAEAKLDVVADIKQSAHVLKYSMALAMKMALDHNSQVFIKFEDRHMYVKCNDVYLSGGLVLNEPYPNYIEALQSYEKTLSIPRFDLVDSISAAISVLDAEDNHRLTMNFSGNTLTLKNSRIEVVHEFDDEFEHELNIDLNGTFLLQIVSDFIGEYIEICFTDNVGSISFRAKDNPDYASLLMLLRLR